jgi:hypothetical protein
MFPCCQYFANQGKMLHGWFKKKYIFAMLLSFLRNVHEMFANVTRIFSTIQVLNFRHLR